MFRTNPFAENHPIMQSNIQFILIFNSSSFLTVNKTVVSSAYITHLAPWCNPHGKSFKYIIKN